MLENYAAILGILATLFGLIGAFGYFPQAFKMYKRRSSADISLGAYMIWLSTGVVWVSYGIATSQWPVIITSAASTTGCLLITALYFRYKKK